jgi:hypothetical protein
VIPLAPSERSIVVFKVWPSLDYKLRLYVSLGSVGFGLAVQIWNSSLLAGLPMIVIGSLFLLVSGYDNRVDFKGYDPGAEWERVEASRLEELIQLDRRIRKWDRSALDVTNVLGGVVFIALTGGLGLVAVLSEGLPRILAIDGALLLLPHWITGVRRVLTRPKLVVKAATIRQVLDAGEERLKKHQVHVMMLLKGTGKTKVPDDIKFKVDIYGHHPDFLGLYGQVVLNEVQGSSYPYFYVVLVARKGFGLFDVKRRHVSSSRTTIETKNQGEVEVLVIRQRTTKKSGYHTPPSRCMQLFMEGLDLAEKVAGGP